MSGIIWEGICLEDSAFALEAGWLQFAEPQRSLPCHRGHWTLFSLSELRGPEMEPSL